MFFRLRQSHRAARAAEGPTWRDLHIKTINVVTNSISNRCSGEVIGLPILFDESLGSNLVENTVGAH